MSKDETVWEVKQFEIIKTRRDEKEKVSLGGRCSGGRVESTTSSCSRALLRSTPCSLLTAKAALLSREGKLTNGKLNPVPAWV